ncbi:MAG: archaemetzincin family Zn-dependent metalloprotease [archaeon]|nr:MAG: archaemetzincin family Zn-dependent metalloprotease [archaeon]
MKIKMVQVGEIQPNILDLIVKDLNRRFKSKFFFGGKIKMPEESYNKFKKQYDARIVMNMLAGENVDADKVLGITSNDLYSGDLNFVFGVAGGDAGLVSTARLDPQFYGEAANFDQLIERTIKEVIHEVAHMFGMNHCTNPECVMSFSNSISYVDDKKNDFCKECTLKISMEGTKI